jgi:glycerol uptake facilitator-like aquaporin
MIPGHVKARLQMAVFATVFAMLSASLPIERSLAAQTGDESIGTLLLLAAMGSSGIMGERLAGGNVALALLANTIATGAALVAIIFAFGPISGAHLNPAVTLGAAMRSGIG